MFSTLMLENNEQIQQESADCSETTCAGCRAVREQTENNDELSFAFLLALVPALTLSLFGNIGLL
jgi:hypothetical protein